MSTPSTRNAAMQEQEEIDGQDSLADHRCWTRHGNRHRQGCFGRWSRGSGHRPRPGGGDIINVSSVAGRTARSGNGVYAATKWGINGWSESLRQELLPDIRVTLVEPGVVATELPSHITHAETRQGVQQLYNKAEVTPEDVAEIISFILSRPRRLAINEILLRPAGQQ
jgi:NAD(P)-dependent dehydrogenase (short-subunit alcohol dehydrogenase family)